ncbi:thioredoxin domain-containing protein [Streptomyces sp. NPDC059740]|uniref:thioredoxin domain-containing protein n=1 Tax=Streptomyces sp. NPDC059740 TaxID=3346926 RepID=UPI003662E3CD
MSNRNNQANKQAARERLRAEREKQKKKDALKRQFIVGGTVVVVIAAAVGIGVAVANSGGGDDAKTSAADVDGASNTGVSTDAAWTKAKKNKVVKPAHTSGDMGTTIVIGKSGAKKTLDLYEDPRCPSCAAFEQSAGSQIVKDVDGGKYKASYHLGAFLDDRLHGVGSKNAISALGAALNVSPDAFLQYKEALYSTKYHPEETGPDKFADDKYLTQVADTVPALKNNASFENALKKGTYDRWALQMSAAFNANKDVQSTPTIIMDGTKISPTGNTTTQMLQSFQSQLSAALKK